MQVLGKEIVAGEGKYIARKGTDNYFKRCTLLKGETTADFIEVDSLPDEKEQQEKAAYAEEVRKKVQNMYYAATMSEKINTFNLTPKEALAVKDLYPEWAVGIDVNVGEKYRLGEDLWQVVQAHKTQENWKPSLATASLWKRIDEEHEGTESDPIPYAPPMQIYQGKYYTQNGVKYKCTRDSGIPLSHNLSDLVGLYVAKV